MKILSRYLNREITRHFCVVLGLLTFVFLAVHFFEKIDKFLDQSAPPTRIFWYFLFKTPYFVAQVFPISFLLAILVTFGIMNRQNELIALKSSGIGIFHLAKSVLALGALFTLILLGLSEIIVPSTIASANRIRLQNVKGGGAMATVENKWLTGDHAFFKIGQYNPADQVIYDFTAYYIDDQFQLVRRLDARRGKFENHEWVFQALLVQKFDPTTDIPEVSFFDRRAEGSKGVRLQPEDLSQIAPETDEMSCKALRAYIRKIETAGDNAIRYRVDLQCKMAFPVVCLIMALIATGVATRGKLKGGLPVTVSLGICIAFLYFFVLSICTSLGYGGKLPPVVAAWVPHSIFLCAGGIVLFKAE